MRLMAIPGPSGRERAAAEAVRRELLAAGARPAWISMDDAGRRSPHLGGGGDCGNLVLRLPGTAPGPRRLLVAHLDTVPLCSFRLPEDHPAVREAMRAVRAAGLDPHAGLATGGLDANWMTARGIPTVTMGAGRHNPHQLGEHLDVREDLAACRVAVLLATGG